MGWWHYHMVQRHSPDDQIVRLCWTTSARLLTGEFTETSKVEEQDSMYVFE